MRVFTKEIAKDIVEVFEDLLDENNIMIDDEFRNGDDGEACLFGETYDEILTKIECMIVEVVEKIDAQKKYETEVEIDTWNNGKWFE